MRKRGYDKATKEGILKAVLDARKAGMKWSAAHEAATKAGYKGSLGGIVQLVRGSKKKASKRGRKAVRRGRKARTTPMASIGPANDIAAMIDNLVKVRVNSAIESAIASLREQNK